MLILQQDSMEKAIQGPHMYIHTYYTTQTHTHIILYTHYTTHTCAICIQTRTHTQKAKPLAALQKITIAAQLTSTGMCCETLRHFSLLQALKSSWGMQGK